MAGDPNKPLDPGTGGTHDPSQAGSDPGISGDKFEQSVDPNAVTIDLNPKDGVADDPLSLPGGVHDPDPDEVTIDINSDRQADDPSSVKNQQKIQDLVSTIPERDPANSALSFPLTEDPNQIGEWKGKVTQADAATKLFQDGVPEGSGPGTLEKELNVERGETDTTSSPLRAPATQISGDDRDEVGQWRAHVLKKDAVEKSFQDGVPEGTGPGTLEKLLNISREDIDTTPSSLRVPATEISGDQNNEVAQWKAHVLKKDREIAAILNGIDNRAFEFLGIGGRFASNSVAPHTPFGAQGTLALDPRLLSKSLINIGNALGKVGLGLFVAEQLTLFGLNHDGPRIYNPASFLATFTPILGGIVPVAIDPSDPHVFSVNEKPGLYERKVNKRREHSMSLSENLIFNERFESRRTYGLQPSDWVSDELIGFAGKFARNNMKSPRSVGADSQDDSLLPKDKIRGYEGPAIPILELALKIRNMYGPKEGTTTTERSVGRDHGLERHARWSVGQIVDAIIDDTQDAPIEDKNVPGQGKIKRKRFKLSEIFDGGRKVDLGWVPRDQVEKADRRFNITTRGTLEKSAFPDGIIPMDFPGEDRDSSIITRAAELPQDQIDDDLAYLPLSFTDVRPFSDGLSDGNFRTIYFRPIITSLTEDFSPEWDKKSFYGRTDQVVTYMSTLRTIFINFELHAFAPEDLKVIYKKLNWLSSMVYPEYDSERLLKAGPVCRMRVGDVIKSGHQGLPGIIDSLSYDYSDSLWELKKNSKVPRSVAVSVSFHVLHDVIIGRGAEGEFGGIGRVDASTGRFTVNDPLFNEDDENAIVQGQRPFRGFGAIGLLGEEPNG